MSHEFRRNTASLALCTALALSAGGAMAGDKEVISSPDAPAAIGPYSQAIRAGGVVYLAGQLPIDAKSGELKLGTIEEQTRLVLDNLKAVLTKAGLTMDDVVSTSVFMKDLNEFKQMNTVYAEYFKDKPPARATVQVARVPRDASIEISAIATK